MTIDKAAPAFMDLPLEVRHSIFEHVAVRDVKPKKLLRYWFEKKEVKELVAQDAIDNPNGPIPRVIYANNDDYHDYDDESTVNDHDSEEDGQEEDENTDEDSENEDGDENEDEDEDEDEDEEAEQDEDSDENEDDSEIDGEDEGEQLHGAVAGAHDTQSATAGVSVPAHAAAQADPDTMMEDAGEVHVDEDESDDEVEAEGDDGEEAEGAQPHGGEEGDDDSEGDEDVVDDDDNTGATVAATQPPAPAPVFRPHHKWRHIPNFMRLTHCPPPLQLLLASHQLNNEAKNWFYDVAVLRIDATGSFAHTSLFEEAFSQITDAAFSPMGK
jgi:hypothetical protein